MTVLDLEKDVVPEELCCDVAIIGAGAVGIAMAVALSRKGHDVVLLEAGGISLEAQSQEIFNRARSTGFKLDGLHSGRFRLLGGTTNFWGGQLVPFDPIVFENRPWLNCEGWLFNRDILTPYYARAMSLLGMDGAEATDAAVWARAATDPPDIGDNLEFFLTRWVKTPNFSRLFKTDLSGPNLRVLVHANVTGLEGDETGKAISRIHVRTFAGRRATVNAKKTILACGTVEIARLLMLPYADGRSTPWHDNPWLGRGYIDHLDVTTGQVTAKSGGAFHDLFENLFFDGYKYNPKIKLSEKAQRDNQLLGIAGSFIFRTSYEDTARDVKMFLRSVVDGRLPPSWWKLPGHLVTLSKVAFPLAYRYFQSNRTFHPSNSAVLFRVTSEQLPVRESRISLRTERDALDMPIVDLNWKIDGTELETIAFFAERVRDALRAADVAELSLDPRLESRDPAFLADAADTYHQMGGSRMGRDAADGVVDSDLRVFGSTNLFVAGAAVIPSSGFANCTLTAISLGLRLCDHVTGLPN